MKLNFLLLSDVDIFEQLRVEEALLRTNEENWCIVNHGSQDAIVMGISAKLKSVVNKEVYQEKPVSLVRRFSGGGTVYVDKNTLFVTFIFNYHSFPDQVLHWTKEFYQPIFQQAPFNLRENDYTIGEKKCGGNAQYFRKERFLHHTSFLYDYDVKNMNYLLYPPKTPIYRGGRNHEDFITKIAPYFPQKEDFVEKIYSELHKQFRVNSCTLDMAYCHTKKEHRQSTSLVKICKDAHHADYGCNSCF